MQEPLYSIHIDICYVRQKFARNRFKNGVKKKKKTRDQLIKFLHRCKYVCLFAQVKWDSYFVTILELSRSSVHCNVLEFELTQSRKYSYSI